MRFSVEVRCTSTTVVELDAENDMQAMDLAEKEASKLAFFEPTFEAVNVMVLPTKKSKKPA